MTILGIDVGGSGIKGAPVDVVEGRMLTERYRIPTPEEATPEAVLEIIAQIIAHFNYSGPLGCTVPARVEAGLVRTATNLHTDWIDTRFDRLLSAYTGMKVRVLNDADAAGLASMRFGIGQETSGVTMMLTIGTGIGSALFLNGNLVPNTELGHIIVEGEIAEIHASDRTRKNLELSWEEWASRFQRVLNRMEFLFSPDYIIIGGGVTRPYKTVEFMPLLSTNATLLVETLENEAGIIGAARAAYDSYGTS